MRDKGLFQSKQKTMETLKSGSSPKGDLQAPAPNAFRPITIDVPPIKEAQPRMQPDEPPVNPQNQSKLIPVPKKSLDVESSKKQSNEKLNEDVPNKDQPGKNIKVETSDQK